MLVRREDYTCMLTERDTNGISKSHQIESPRLPDKLAKTELGARSDVMFPVLRASVCHTYASR